MLSQIVVIMHFYKFTLKSNLKEHRRLVLGEPIFEVACAIYIGTLEIPLEM